MGTAMAFVQDAQPPDGQDWDGTNEIFLEMQEKIAGEAITAGDPVAIDANLATVDWDTVYKCDGSANEPDLYWGIATNTVAAGGIVKICRKGVVKVTTDGSLTKGHVAYVTDAEVVGDAAGATTVPCGIALATDVGTVGYIYTNADVYGAMLGLAPSDPV